MKGMIASIAIPRDDTIFAGHGNDFLIAGAGRSTIVAGEGNDSIRGREGIDTISGNAGNDVFLYSSASEDGNNATGGGPLEFMADVDWAVDRFQVFAAVLRGQ